jgi:hypothetical protein
MPEVCSAGSPLQADVLKVVSDGRFAGLPWSTQKTQAIKQGFSRIGFVFNVLAFGRLQSADVTDQVKSTTHGTASARGSEPETGPLGTGCRKQRSRSKNDRLRKSQKNFCRKSVTKGVYENFVSRLAAILRCGCFELLTIVYPHSDVHTRGLRLCNR